MNISLLVGLKNNLDYSKHFYETTRTLYPTVEICFVSYGSTDGTHEWLDRIGETDKHVNYSYSENNRTFADTFNKAMEIATKDYVAYLHNDIIVTANFCENILKHCNESTVVSYTTIEPPIFSGHVRPGKIIRDFGTNLINTQLDEIYEFSWKQQDKDRDKIEPGITFFMCQPRELAMKMGGLDNLFNPCFCEDDDLILRHKILGSKLITSLDAICYHYVSKTSRFSEEYKNRTNEIEIRSQRNFIRKWGFRSSYYNKKYDIGFIINNMDSAALEILEPWCSTLYSNCDPKYYLEYEQRYTNIDLKTKLKSFTDPRTNDILVEFDLKLLTQDQMNFIMILSDAIAANSGLGTFKHDIFKLTINNVSSYEDSLINLHV
jgi:GT2 family glycosyltransferase